MTNYVLFVCGHNAGRSQMAQTFFNYHKSEFPSVDRAYEAISAGTRHGDRVNPLVIQVMGEVGIDLNDPEVYFPKGLDSQFVRTRGSSVERVIVACDDRCELPPEIRKGLTLEYWKLPDPHQKPIGVVREVRNLTRERVYGLLQELKSQLG